MQAFHDIAQYRVIQENKESILVHLVKGKTFNVQTPGRIREEIEKVTKQKLKVEIEVVDELSRDESGKIRTIVSKISPNMQDRIEHLTSS